MLEIMSNEAESSAKIIVIGVGGAGNNAVNRMVEEAIGGVEFVGVNTDKQALTLCKAPTVLQIGEKITKGLGAGAQPEVGQKAAEESIEEVKQLMEGADMVFVTCGLGGGTGTGSAPIISKLSKKLGALTVAVATMPFSAEGIKRRENAEQGLEKLQDSADTVIVIPNDKLLEVAPNLPLNKAFMVSDEILGRAVKGITELITKKGLVSLDFADIRSIMGGSGMAMIGMGESDTGDRALESVHEALSSPLLDIDISNATGALVNISGSSDLTLHEAEKIVQVVADKLDPEANIIWGTQIDESLQNTVRTTVVVSGIKTGNSSDKEYELEYAEEKSESKSADDQLDDFIDGVF